MQPATSEETVSIECWFFVRQGRLYIHEENDGPAFLRKGPQKHESEISLDEVAREYPSHLQDVKALLAAGVDGETRTY